MKPTFLRSLTGLACALLLTATARAQCDADQSFPSNCLCIYLCHSAVTANNSCSINVDWTVGSESTGDYYEIWRTYSTSQAYSLVTTVNGIYSTGGAYTYTYTDNNPPNPDGGAVYYIIKMFTDQHVLKSQTPVRSATPTCAVPNSCSGIYTQTNLTGKSGDVIVLRLSYGGYVSWNGISNGAGASISISCAGQTNGAGSAHYYGSGGFSLTADITITMPANTATISTAAVVNNSTTMYSSTATISILSINGVAQTTQAVVCGGNSQGAW